MLAHPVAASRHGGRTSRDPISGMPRNDGAVDSFRHLAFICGRFAGA